MGSVEIIDISGFATLPALVRREQEGGRHLGHAYIFWRFRSSFSLIRLGGSLFCKRSSKW